MKNYIVVTCDFSGFGLAMDKRLEGSRVIFAYKAQEEDVNADLLESEGKGLFETAPLDKVFKNRNKFKDWYWIFDSNHNWEYGETLRKEGFKVFGGSEFTYKLEEDRAFGMDFAESCGLISPLQKEFNSVEEGIKFLEENEDKAFVYKPNNQDCAYTTVPTSDDPISANIEIRRLIKSLGFTDYILQEKVRGVEVNTEVWFCNGNPVISFCDLEDKLSHNGDKGNPSGCMFDIAWEVDIDSPIIKMTVGKMFKALKEINYTGFADCNAIISDYNNVNFLEYCFRLGFNMFPTIINNLSEKSGLEVLSEIIDGELETEFKRGFGASVNVNTDMYKEGLPIYIPETIKDSTYVFDGMKDEESDNDDDIVMVGYSKEICIAMAHDYTPATALQAAMYNASKIKFPRAYYRTDADSNDIANSITRRFEALSALKLI